MRFKAFLSVLLLLTILVAGCSQTTATKGGELVRLWADPSTLDPHLTSDVDSSV
ncbi:MAG: hypothetical protein HW402_1563, partial [Dehalococcoidales bacterium]|nr:hypothetical protein [Dehalococcoidales bacterium]